MTLDVVPSSSAGYDVKGHLVYRCLHDMGAQH